MNRGPLARRDEHGGFSLIELMVVMAVLGVLAAASFPLAELVVQRERERALRLSLWEIRNAIDAYKRAVDTGMVATSANASGYPATLTALSGGVPNLKQRGEVIYFLRRLPPDPFSTTDGPAEQTWGLRSYASPPDQPKPGGDVYDVYSTSTKTGLNGIPLRNW